MEGGSVALSQDQGQTLTHCRTLRATDDNSAYGVACEFKLAVRPGLRDVAAGPAINCEPEATVIARPIDIGSYRSDCVIIIVPTLNLYAIPCDRDGLRHVCPVDC